MASRKARMLLPFSSPFFFSLFSSLSLSPFPCSTAAAAPAPPQVMSCTSWSQGQLCSTDKVGVTSIGVLNGAVGAMTGTAQYYHGYFSAALKLPANNSQGTITAFYLADTVSSSNKDENHIEIDVEFYGNKDPRNIMLATNVFFRGEQNLAQFSLPFDPSETFHTYSIIWNHKSITWLIDSSAIRILNRSPLHGWAQAPMLPLVTNWQMSWGDVHPDYTSGPIATQVRTFQFSGCAYSSPTAAQGVCPFQVGPVHSWNKPLAPWQLAGITPTAEGGINQKLLLNAWGWDKA